MARCFPARGLRINDVDLARIGQMMARGGKGFISAPAFAEMIRPQWRFDGTNGLGENGEGTGFSAPMGWRCRLWQKAARVPR
jgi:CubicO group peptidase (beta-lactamase class C family)